MKILMLDMFFELPKDFKGNYTDALKEYIKYRESLDKSYPTEVSDEDEDDLKKAEREDSLSNYRFELWNKFIKARNMGKKMAGVIGVLEWDSDKNNWINLLDHE